MLRLPAPMDRHEDSPMTEQIIEYPTPQEIREHIARAHALRAETMRQGIRMIADALRSFTRRSGATRPA